MVIFFERIEAKNNTIAIPIIANAHFQYPIKINPIVPKMIVKII